MKHIFVQKLNISQTKRNDTHTYIEVTARQESTTYINGFEFQFRPTSNVTKFNPKKSFCEANLGQNYLL